MKLTYLHRPFDGTIPAPELDEDWARNDHDEPDDGLAARKIASGMFERAPALDEPVAQPLAAAAAVSRAAEPERPGADEPSRGRGGPGR